MGEIIRASYAGQKPDCAITYYIKTAADDVRNAMSKLENHIEKSEDIRIFNVRVPNQKCKLSVVQ